MKRPSPSMCVALLALFISLAGTATAAKLLSGRDIRDGTIRRADIAKSAVDSKKVANGSLSSRDFDADARGALSQAGTQALEAFRASGPDNNAENTEKTVATLSNIPPGAYAIFAKTVLSGVPTPPGFLEGAQSVGGKCTLDVDGDGDESRTPIGGPGSNTPGTVHMQITRTYGAPGTAKVICSVTNAEWRASNTSIIALRVSAPQKQAVDGR